MSSTVQDNPFHPVDLDAGADARSPLKEVWLPGGFITITVLGIISGLIIAGVLWNNSGLLTVFAVPLFCMFGVSAFCMSIMQGLKLSSTAKLAITAATTLASYVMFFPVCIGGGLLSMMAGFEQGYGPDSKGLYATCVLAAILSLNFVFWFYFMIVERSAQRRQIQENAQRVTEDS